MRAGVLSAGASSSLSGATRQGCSSKSLNPQVVVRYRALGLAAVRLDPAAGSDTEALTERSEVVDALPVMGDDQGAARYFVPGEVTVRFTAETGDERARALVPRQGSTVLTAQRTTSPREAEK